MTWDDYSKTLIALALFREGRGEVASVGKDALRAIGHVIRNRVQAKWGDWDTVITKKNQFSSMSVGGDSQLIVWPDDDKPTDKPLFELCMSITDAIFDGSDADLTGGALYYWNAKTATSGWFKQKVDSGEFVKTVTIGHHDFYKEA